MQTSSRISTSRSKTGIQSISRTGIQVDSVAYCHNYDPTYRDELEHPIYSQYIEAAPLFLKGEMPKLREYSEARLQTGDGGELLWAIDESDLRPSKSLQDAILSILKGNEEFTLLGSQKVVFEEAMSLAQRAVQNGEKHVLIVDRKPGTGKTVVAVNLLIESLQHDLTAQYVSKIRRHETYTTRSSARATCSSKRSRTCSPAPAASSMPN